MTPTATRKKWKKIVILDDTWDAESEIYNDIVDGHGGVVVTTGTTEGTCKRCNATDIPLGIALNTVRTADITAYEADPPTRPKSAIEVQVQLDGISPVTSGGIIAMLAWVKSNAAGRVVAANLDGTEELIGFCLDASTGNGQTTHIKIHKIPQTVR